MRRVHLFLWIVAVAGLLELTPAPAAAQQSYINGRYFPLSQWNPPGTVARWAVQSGQVTPWFFQPVRFELPTSGRITVYDRTPDQAIPLEGPAQAAFLVGQVYRVKLDNLPEFPNVELYPSIEILDRLHPPPGQIDEYPVLVQISEEDIVAALDGRLVTKVIYLEQPQLVIRENLDSTARVRTLRPDSNSLAEADVLGRPMAILRIGGRVPDPQQRDAAFFGPGAPVRVGRLAPPPKRVDLSVPNPSNTTTTARPRRIRQ